MPDLYKQLIDAAKSGDLPGVQAALAAGADVNAEDYYALRLAAEYGHVSVVSCLLAAGADLRGAQGFLLSNREVSERSATDLARKGVFPEALCVLLKRQGLVDLAATLSATKMLEPLTPAARAELLGESLATQTHPETSPASH